MRLRWFIIFSIIIRMEQQIAPDEASRRIDNLVHETLSGVYYREALRRQSVDDLRAKAATATSPETQAMWLRQADELEAIHREETQLPELFHD